MSLRHLADDADNPEEASDVRAALAEVLLVDALHGAPARRLARGESTALVLKVPGPDWVAPLATAVESAWPNTVVVSRDGSSKDHRPSSGNVVASAALASGRAVVGISHNPSACLPSALVSCADAHVVVDRPDAGQLRRMMRRCGHVPVPREVPAAAASGLTFDEIAACFRQGTGGRKVLAALRRAREGKARTTPTDRTPALQDLPGCPAEARAWGLSLAAGIQDWKRGEADWAGLPAAGLLFGPPGTGKTTFAKSLARTCGLSFHPTAVGEWFSRTDGHLGDVAKALQTAWDAAAASRPSLFFCDELEALPSRERLTNRAREWWTPIITLALTLFDGATTDREGIVLLGATNHRDLIDPALRRRLDDREILMPTPGPEAVAEVMAYHLDGRLCPADLLPIVRQSAGATPADAARWALGARERARRAHRAVDVGDVAAEVLPPDPRPRADLLRCARHEAAHAVVGLLLGEQDLDCVTLRPSSGADGMAVFQHIAGRPATRAHLEALVVTGLAGRAADALFGEADAQAGGGPGSDLAHASRILAMLHGVFGLGDTLLCLGPPEEAAALLRADPKLRAVVDADLRRLYGRAQTLVGELRLEIEMLARALLSRRHLSAAEVRALLARVRCADASRLAHRRSSP